MLFRSPTLVPLALRDLRAVRSFLPCVSGEQARLLPHQSRILLSGNRRNPVRIGDLTAAGAIPRGGLDQPAFAKVGNNAIYGLLALAEVHSHLALGNSDEAVADLVAGNIRNQATLGRCQAVGTLAFARGHPLSIFRREAGLQVL